MILRKLNQRKAQTGLIYLFGGLILILFLGVLFAVGSAVTNYVLDTTAPEFTSLGMAGDFNASEASTFVITPLNTFVQSLNWVMGVVYVLCLLTIIGLAYVFRSTEARWVMPLFICFMFLLVIVSIFVSNIYEDFYNDTGDVGERLQEQTLLSFMILYSPAILSLIAVIAGIILFGGVGDEQYA